MITDEDIRAINDCLYNCRAKLSDLLDMNKVPNNIKLNFNLTGRTAGRAFKHEIRLNVGLFVRNKEGFFQRTIPHEYAHFVTYYLYPYERVHHGYKWKHIMKLLECSTDRCHSYDTSEVSKTRRTYEVKCACSIHKVGKNIYEKVLNGQKRHCFTCKGNITLT